MIDAIIYCEDCKYAIRDSDSAHDDKFFPAMMRPQSEIIDCRKDFYPHYNDEEGCFECYGKEYINEE